MPKELKIFVSAHKPPSDMPNSFIPVQAGAAINPPIEGIIGDDRAPYSISEKNPEYCELTVLYYAFKNESADYVGLCHYRRFPIVEEKMRRPYDVSGKRSGELMERLTESEKKLLALTDSDYDVIAPRAEDLGLSVREQYSASKYCYGEDLLLFEKIIGERYPHLVKHADEYLSGSRQYLCNIFIMKRDLLLEYCEILFDLLEAFDERKTRHGDFQSDRTDGYLGERFFGIYMSYLKAQGAKIYECARLDTECSLIKRITYRIFPPESRIRFFIKSLIS